ncbi:hypothetical protein SAMN05192575_106192 [Nocardioides alpinus]|uniref:Uncharacterized protein n=1 Tax=Nocardioides alpinus TaxID=748909 RepID=A0A1I0ZRR9_9ACTN|nr:hypothetical protein SAMN05192575_106192 [Nocardioides alpinus]
MDSSRVVMLTQAPVSMPSPTSGSWYFSRGTRRDADVAPYAVRHSAAYVAGV